MYKLLVKHHKSLGHKLRKGSGKPARMFEPGQVRTHEVRNSEMPMPKLPKEMTGGMVKRPLRYKL